MATQTPYSANLGDREPLRTIRDSGDRIRQLTNRWSADAFERSYAPGKWTARQILIHLAQTELALGNRARMALTTPNYGAQKFDQDQWVEREGTLDARTAVDALVALMTMNRRLFESLSDADRAVPFSHPEYGALTVDWIICLLAGHQLHHLAQLEQIDQAAAV